MGLKELNIRVLKNKLYKSGSINGTTLYDLLYEKIRNDLNSFISDKISPLYKEIENCKISINETNKSLRDHIKEFNSLRESLEEIKNNFNEKVNSLNDDIEGHKSAFDKRINSISNQLNNFDKKIEDLYNRTEENYKEDIKELKNELGKKDKELQQNKKEIQKLSEAFRQFKESYGQNLSDNLNEVEKQVKQLKKNSDNPSYIKLVLNSNMEGEMENNSLWINDQGEVKVKVNNTIEKLNK